jgi:hypothetical protein
LHTRQQQYFTPPYPSPTIPMVPYHHQDSTIPPSDHQDGTIPPSGWYHTTIRMVPYDHPGPIWILSENHGFYRSDGGSGPSDHPRMVPYHHPDWTIPPSGGYHTTIRRVPYHHPDCTIPPSGGYHTTIRMVPYHHPDCTIPRHSLSSMFLDARPPRPFGAAFFRL